MVRNTDFTLEVDKGVGRQIQNLRISHGLSRQQLSKKIGVTHQQLQKYEKGLNRIPLGRLILVAQIFKKPTSFFLDEYEAEEAFPDQHRRMCIEVSRNFMKIEDPKHQNAINSLIRTLAAN